MPIDRKAYELCVLSELRDRLRAGDVWVDGSRQYRISLPLDIETDIGRYLEDRRESSGMRIGSTGRVMTFDRRFA